MWLAVLSRCAAPRGRGHRLLLPTPSHPHAQSLLQHLPQQQPALALARGLRTRGGTGRRPRAPVAAAAAAAAGLDRPPSGTNAGRRGVAPSPLPPLPRVPAFIRVRDLAKLLKQPLETVLRAVVTRRNRRFHMTLGDSRFEFKTVKEIILPFDVAERVAASLGAAVAFEDLEPTLATWPARTVEAWPPQHVFRRGPVIAVMGHVDHGKTTLLDALRGSSVAATEAHGITQKINVCEADLGPGAATTATFLDTPGHFHFFRMRTSAAQVADLVLLVVAADDGCGLQTEESVGAIETTGLPTIACINKIDVAPPGAVEAVRHELRSFVALQTCPVVELSARTGEGLEELRDQVAQLLTTAPLQRRLAAFVGPEAPTQGVVLESLVVKGRGTVLRVLVKSGVLKTGDHFVAGMIHGVVRSLRRADGGVTLAHAVPGTVVDVTFANKSKNVDAPIEFGFFVLPAARAQAVIEQRQLALDFAESALPVDEDADDSDPDADPDQGRDARPQQPTSSSRPNDDEDTALAAAAAGATVRAKSIVVKADGAGSLASIQDTVDEMTGINTVRIGIGHVSARDIDVAINRECPIFGFKVKLRRREEKLAAARGVRVVLRSTIHGLLDEIEAFRKAPSGGD